MDTSWREAGSSTYIFSYVPSNAGTFKINVNWDERAVPGLCNKTCNFKYFFLKNIYFIYF